MFYIFLFVILLILAATYIYVFAINKNLRVKFWGIFSLIAIALIFITFLFNLSFEKFRKDRIDLTDNKAYTISKYTVKILKSVKAPINVTYYVTPRDKMSTPLKNLERDVRDKLEEMKIASDGRFRYKIVHPEINSKFAEKLQRKGITPKKIQSIESDEWSLKLAFSALEIKYLQQDAEVIPFIAPNSLNNLEYEIASRIYKLSYGADTTDYSDDSLFTLDKARSDIYPKLPGKIILYYVDNIAENSSHLPDKLKGVREKIKTKLSEIADASNGKIIFQKQNDKITKQLLFVLGRRGLLEGVPIKKNDSSINLGKNKNKNPKLPEKKVYSAVYMNFFKKEESTIPLASKDNLDKLIIEINKKIVKKINKKKPKVALYSPREKLDPKQRELAMRMGKLDEMEDKYSICSRILQGGNYDLVKTDISKKSPIPLDAKTLIILDPSKLSDRQVYEIEKFIHLGRNVIIAAQRYKFDFSPNGSGSYTVIPKKQDFKLGEVIKKYGVTMDKKILMDKKMEVLNITVRKPANFGGFRVMAQTNEPVKTPVQIKLTESNFNKEYSLGNRIQRLLYFGGSRFKLDKEKLKQNGIDYTIAIHGSDKCWNVDYSRRLNMTPPTDAKMYLNKPVLAIFMKGKFPSYYKDKEVPLYKKEVKLTAEEKKKLPPYIQKDTKEVPDESTKEANQIVGDARESKIILIGSSEVFKNDFMNDTNHQLFFLNCVDALTLGEDLIHIRSKVSIDSSLKETSETEKDFWKFFVIGLVPLLFGIIGTFIITIGNIRANA